MTGHNSIKMTELSEMYRDIGFIDVETYIASGNVIFGNDDELKIPELSLKIEKMIFEKFSYNIPVLIRTPEELRGVIYSNPFREEKNLDLAKMAVIFLYKKTSEAEIQRIADIDYPPDKFKVIGSEIFIYCPNGFGRTKLYTNFFEKKMGVIGTARNWKTINTLLSIAERKS